MRYGFTGADYLPLSPPTLTQSPAGDVQVGFLMAPARLYFISYKVEILEDRNFTIASKQVGTTISTLPGKAGKAFY